MPSQLDLDQGGTFRQWQKVDMGPTIGLVPQPRHNQLGISAAGSYTLDPSTNFVQVSIAGAVTITLPSLSPTPATQAALPGIAANARTSIVIVDIGGFAGTNHITIQPAAGDTIMGLASIQISVNYGAFTLSPAGIPRTWSSVSP
jgi:hypothetical protein